MEEIGIFLKKKNKSFIIEPTNKTLIGNKRAIPLLPPEDSLAHGCFSYPPNKVNILLSQLPGERKKWITRLQFWY
jgi:hypothetical protein